MTTLTRRQFLTTAAAAGAVSCMGQKTDIRPQIRALENAEGLSILGMDLTGYTLTEGKPHELLLPEGTPERAVSPDANWVAWVPRSARATSPTGGEPVISISNGMQQPVQSIRYEGRFCEGLAISAAPLTLSLLYVDHRARHRIAVVDIESDGPLDLGEAIAPFDIATIERLNLSAKGHRIAIGSRTMFMVLEIPSRDTLFEARGRFPALSPDGERLAFIDGQKLITRQLGTGVTRQLLEGLLVDGIGAWSPDGTLLLVGASIGSSLRRKLLAVDIRNNSFAELLGLGEGDFGRQYAWIKRRFLSS